MTLNIINKVWTTSRAIACKSLLSSWSERFKVQSSSFHTQDGKQSTFLQVHKVVNCKLNEASMTQPFIRKEHLTFLCWHVEL